MATNAAMAIANFLATAGFGTLGVDLFVSLPRDGDGIPDASVWVYGTGGAPLDPHLGGNTRWRYPTVDVRFRSAIGGDSATEAAALSAIDALDRATVSGFNAVLVRVSSPTPLGADARQRFEWTINVELWAMD